MRLHSRIDPLCKIRYSYRLVKRRFASITIISHSLHEPFQFGRIRKAIKRVGLTLILEKMKEFEMTTISLDKEERNIVARCCPGEYIGR